MLPRVKLQTNEGMREYMFAQDWAAYESAKNAGEIKVGDDLIYREYLVHILPEYRLLVIARIGPVGFTI